MVERAYQIILAVGAREDIREMDEVEQDLLATALRTELLDDDGEPMAEAWIQVRRNPATRYAVHQLTSGHVVIFRLAARGELEDEARRRGDKPADRGVVVFDILSGGDTLSGGVVLPGG